MLLADLTKKTNIAVLGYALEGQSTYRFLLAQGISPACITILDKKEVNSIPKWTKSICGTAYMDNLEQFDCIIRTPWITNTIITTESWKTTAWLPLTSQTEIFLSNYTGTIIGITGTKGKSTISTLAYLTLKQANKDVLLAGNVGKPILDLIDRKSPPEMVVYELSSFMIESVFMQRKGRKIDIAVFNTLYNTHTKEHGWYENYARAKVLLLEHSTEQLIWSQAKAILNEQFPDIVLPSTTRTYGKEGTYTRDGTYFQIDTKNIYTDEWMVLIWAHNRENACAVLGICDLLHIDYTHLQSVLATFWWLEHRLEYVGKYHDIQRYNDAIATTPQATCAALDSFWEQIDTLFYGGVLGEYDHQLVAEKIRDYGIRHLVLFPDTGSVLYELLDNDTKERIEAFHTRSMHDAVQRASQKTKPWAIALLSCWSPSFSIWSWFVEKWTLFKEEARKIDTKKTSI